MVGAYVLPQFTFSSAKIYSHIAAIFFKGAPSRKKGAKRDIFSEIKGATKWQKKWDQVFSRSVSVSVRFPRTVLCCFGQILQKEGAKIFPKENL